MKPLLLGALALAGCATTPVSAPSLLPRAIETRSDEEPSRPAPVVVADPVLDAQVAALVKQRDAASAAYAAADRAVAAQLRAGAKAAVGSDAWLDAQTAMAALDVPRADLLAVLTDLEQLASGRALAGLPAYPAIDAARIDSEVELDRITAAIAARRAQLPLP